MMASSCCTYAERWAMSRGVARGFVPSARSPRASTRPASTSRSVVLPAPEGPMIAMTRPGWHTPEMFLRMVFDVDPLFFAACPLSDTV